MPAGPLTGVRVIDLTRLLPGAYATLLMADLGADIVKIEDPRGGDPSRTLPPVADGTSAYFRVLNRNKRSVTLDLRSGGAAPVLDALIARADILVESFRPQTARWLGVDAAALCARHPRLIHASVNGFGQTGPRGAQAAHDINFEALAGLLTAGAMGSPPQFPRMLIGDIGAAMNAAAGILAALYQRERTGMGVAVEVSIHEAALSWLLVPAARQLVAGDDPDALDLPVGGDHACYNIYRTADGRYLALGALEPKFWAAFCERAGREDLRDLQYVRGDQQSRLLAEVRALMETRPREEWLALFGDIDVCLTPVNTVADALGDPHLAARGARARHGGTLYLTTPIVVTEDPAGQGDRAARRIDIRPAPSLGADTDEVLRDAGLPPAEIARLRELHII
jgi:crotonobetainyl-CoA:carnitine CoA-transferase CaiB-like acyl-CoA transferase